MRSRSWRCSGPDGSGAEAYLCQNTHSNGPGVPLGASFTSKGKKEPANDLPAEGLCGEWADVCVVLSNVPESEMAQGHIAGVRSSGAELRPHVLGSNSTITSTLQVFENLHHKNVEVSVYIL